MKYMGSKRAMLENGLGKLLITQAEQFNRVVDLFCGAGYVAWFAAENTTKPVLAVDLQKYAVTLAQSVISRDKALDYESLRKKWLIPVKRHSRTSIFWKDALKLERSSKNIYDMVNQARQLCEISASIGPVWNAYGGYYFSPKQAITFDYLINLLPQTEPEKTVCLAALIGTASKCAAAPGHTAQPFQPTETAGKFIKLAWDFDPIEVCKGELKLLCPKHAQTIGEGRVGNALEIASTLSADDLVFVDPPYSNVQYSRFYHVFETIARGDSVSVNGAGRYPPIIDRPQSGFSREGEAKQALTSLLSGLSQSQATVIFTFPSGDSSNGLSGQIIKDQASIYFDIEETIVDGIFSTLGGNNSGRSSRKDSKELILLLKPK